MIWAVGKPGEPVRIYVDGISRARAELQQGPEEVVADVVEKLPFAVMLEDGSGIVEGAPPEDWEMNLIRARRTAMLANTQWVLGEDSPYSEDQKAAWRIYRQALRDLPSAQPGATLETVDWPVPPGQ